VIIHGLILCLSLLASAPSAAEIPSLQIEAPPQLVSVRMRLEGMAPDELADIAQFLGIKDAGAAIHVVLAPENSDMARRVVAWIAGFAVGESSLVVLFPARSPGYPDSTIEDVLRHEVAHVLIWRASGGHYVPRWFDEGLAMEVERQRRWQDQTQLLYQLVSGGETDLQHLDGLFTGGQNDQTRAYALAGAFVHDLLKEHGPAAATGILMSIHNGAAFDVAFADIMGVTAAHAEANFWRRQRIWTSWVPIITSTTVLWLVVTLLALAAIYVRRRRNRQIEEQWAREEHSDVDNGLN
jgi:hypothetical protein